MMITFVVVDNDEDFLYWRPVFTEEEAIKFAGKRNNATIYQLVELKDEQESGRDVPYN